MDIIPHNRWRHRFALLTALATLGLIAIGGLVTSKGVGMAVPDWPTSYGYNMFALPFSMWFTGGVFHEHTHRQWASYVGVLVVILARWLGGEKSRRPLMVIGAVELLAGFALFVLGTEWRGAGGFLSGIGGVVFLAGVAWVKNPTAEKPLPALAWWAFWLVQVQGLLGGLRVVLDAYVIAGTKLGVVFGLIHGCLAQGFFALLCVIGLLTSRWWNFQFPISNFPPAIRRALLFTTILIFCQLILGATMRHQHAGLAIADFPLAHGKIWPDMSASAIASYNAQRMEISGENPITAAQIVLQMAHRAGAILILVAVSFCAWRARGILRRPALLWLALILVQATLGAFTIWRNKAADLATLHVVVGALSLVTGVLLTIIALRFSAARTK